jgi:hypothetical protein
MSYTLEKLQGIIEKHNLVTVRKLATNAMRDQWILQIL